MVVTADIDGDGRQPGECVRIAPEAMDLLEGLQEGILDGVLREGRVPEVHCTQTQQPAAMLNHQGIEGFPCIHA